MNSESGNNDLPEHWTELARLWEQTGPPLRPAAKDVSFLLNEINSWSRENGSPRALILGVTPELYRMAWPSGTNVLAVDHTRGMIDVVWPGPRGAVVCAEWTDLPLQTGSRDITLCDGGVHLLNYPGDHDKLVRSVYRVLASGGLSFFRLFVPPKEREESDTVLKDLLEGRISNLNLLKLRLGMALQEDVAEGVQMGHVWDAIHNVSPDLNRLASQIGWPIEHLLVINTYRNSKMRYHFLGIDEVRHLFCESPGGFEFEKLYVPEYALGERCPTIVLRRKAGSIVETS